MSSPKALPAPPGRAPKRPPGGRACRAPALLFITLAWAGCGGGEAPAGPPGGVAAGGPEIVYVSPDPLGVNPFLILGQTGVERAAARHGGHARVIEASDPTTREESVRAAVAGGATIVVVLGFEFNDILARVAPEAPGVEFLIVDQCMDDPPPNVHCAVFREHEAAYLLGAIAAMLSHSHRVGTIGAVDIPFLHRYTDAFAAGARHVDPTIAVAVRWVGGERPFADPVRAKEQALAMAAEGVDHVFAAAAAGNLGIFEAAREQGFFAFGLDVDQCPAAPGHIVDNLIKRVDVVIGDAVDAILQGSSERRLVYGLASRGLDIVALAEPPPADSRCLIVAHPEVRARARALAADLAAGRIVLPDPMARP